MIALQIQDIKDFMSRLLLSSAFDAFLVVEGSVTTFSAFQIDGRLPATIRRKSRRPPEFPGAVSAAGRKSARFASSLSKESGHLCIFALPFSFPLKTQKSCFFSQTPSFLPQT